MAELQVIIASDVDYEKLIAEMYVDDKLIAQISQEHGPEKLQIEFPDCSMSQSAVVRKLDLTSFEELLQAAVKRLLA